MPKFRCQKCGHETEKRTVKCPKCPAVNSFRKVESSADAGDPLVAATQPPTTPSEKSPPRNLLSGSNDRGAKGLPKVNSNDGENTRLEGQPPTDMPLSGPSVPTSKFSSLLGGQSAKAPKAGSGHSSGLPKPFGESLARKADVSPEVRQTPSNKTETPKPQSPSSLEIPDAITISPKGELLTSPAPPSPAPPSPAPPSPAPPSPTPPSPTPPSPTPPSPEPPGQRQNSGIPAEPLVNDAEAKKVTRSITDSRVESTPEAPTVSRPTVPQPTVAELPLVEETVSPASPPSKPLAQSKPAVTLETATAPKGDSRSDRIAWTLRETGSHRRGPQPLRNCPAVDSDGRIYACLQDQLVAFRESRAGDEIEVLWRYAAGGFVPGSPAVGPDGHVRFHADDGLLHCVNNSGQACWTADVGEPLGWAAPAIDESGTTWVSSLEAGLLKVESDGAIKRRPYFRSVSKFDCPGVLLDSTLYLGCEDHFVYAIDLAERRGNNRWDHAPDLGETKWYINSAPALLDSELLIVASRDQHLYAFQLDGSTVYRVQLPGQVLGSPVVDGDGSVFVGIRYGDDDGKQTGGLICIDGRTGKQRWAQEVNAAVESTPVVGADGLVYFGDNQGAIYSANTSAKGRIETIAELGSAVRSAGTLVSPGRIMFGLDNGELVALRCPSKELASGWPKYLGSVAQHCRGT
jgi:outer membrane protein assembly factor BamB